MAFDPHQVERIRLVLKRKKVAFTEKKMIGGICILVDDKMLLGTHINKGSNESLLMARIGIDAVLEGLKRPYCREMNFTGRVMKDYIYVLAEGYDCEDDLEYWIDAALTFNPMAKASNKRV